MTLFTVMQSIPEYLIESVFFGFGILIPISTFLLFSKNVKFRALLTDWIDAAIIVVIPAGIIFLFMWLNWCLEEFAFINRKLSWLWLYYFANVVWTQLFWF